MGCDRKVASERRQQAMAVVVPEPIMRILPKILPGVGVNFQPGAQAVMHLPTGDLQTRGTGQGGGQGQGDQRRVIARHQRQLAEPGGSPEAARLLDAPRLTERLRSARLSPARAPLVSVAHDGARHPLSEEIRHTPDGPVITFRLPGASGTQTIIHDHAGGAPARSAGVAWRGPGSWLTRPGVRASGREGLYVASAASRGGNEPWAQLLTAALVAYAAHGSLTGEDIRPANRDYRP